jgi:hypothetical protein
MLPPGDPPKNETEPQAETAEETKINRTSRPSHQPVHLELDSDATSVMVPHAPPVVAPPPVFKPDWETLARLALRRPPSVSFVAQLTNRSPLGFEAQTKKPSR